MTDQSTEQDDLRPCPICRTPISVLAVRCRHCGAEVGRPRKEAEKFTVKDLGGSAESTYTLSGNVMEALESFRAEELNKQETERRQKEAVKGTWFGQRHPDQETSKPADDGLPELDAAHRDLAALDEEPAAKAVVHVKPKTKPASAAPDISRKLFLMASIVAGLILIYLGTDLTWGKIKDYLENRNAGDKVVYVNKARDLLARGDVLDALLEANEALKFNKTDENYAIVKEMRACFVQDVLGMLSREIYDPQDYQRASEMADRALKADGDAAIRDLYNKVRAEVAAYKMVCASIDFAGKQAVFKVFDAAQAMTEQKVGENGRLNERFVVTSISQYDVRLKDERVAVGGNRFRNVIARVGSPLAGQ